MTSITHLIAKAQSAKPLTFTYTRTSRWLPVARILRDRGWTWKQIHEWLRRCGEPVQNNQATFIASMSRSFRREERRIAAKLSAKPIQPKPIEI